jgi:IMP dehydrogenase/GMP reductase
MLGSLLAGTDEAPGEEIISREENSSLTREWEVFLQ